MINKFNLLVSIFMLLSACQPNHSAPNPQSDASKVQTMPPGRFLGQLPPTASIQEEGVGFLNFDSISARDPIQQAGDSIFALFVLGSDQNQIKTYSRDDYKNGKFIKLRTDISAASSMELDPRAQQIILAEISACEEIFKTESNQTCNINADLRRSTGFLARDGKTLWTNMHVFESLFTKASDLADHPRLNLFVFDRKQKMLLNPFKDVIKLGESPVLTGSAISANALYSVDCDYVSVELPLVLGSPLHVAESSVRAGDRVYILGYPACTGCDPKNFGYKGDTLDFHDRSPQGNSDGASLLYSVGKIIADSDGKSLTYLENFFAMKAGSLSVFELHKMLFATADSNHGNSGGPWLNAAGEVVAIHTGGQSRWSGKLERVSRAVTGFWQSRPSSK